MNIRRAAQSDAHEVAGLTMELGYRVDPILLSDRLARILEDPRQHVFVAEIERTVHGWVHAAVCEYLERPAFVVIGGLVVRKSMRRQGLGTKLMGSSIVMPSRSVCAA